MHATPAPPLSSTSCVKSTSSQNVITLKRSSIFELWLHELLHTERSKNEGTNEGRKKKFKLERRRKRREIIRKLFGRKTKDEVGHPMMIQPEEKEFMVNMENVYKETLERSSCSTADVEEDTTVVSDQDEQTSIRSEGDIVAPVPEIVMMTDEDDAEDGSDDDMYVIPPVTVPHEYLLLDRRGGNLVAGRYVILTSAAFKHKQRQFLFAMCPIHEHQTYVSRPRNRHQSRSNWI